MITDQEVIQFFGKFAEIPPDQKIDSQIFRGGENNFPLGCSRHLELFSKLNVIPKYCFDCFKVLISPRNVVELFKVLMIFEKISLPNDNRRKCMVEERKEFSGTYKGYVFCKGLDEGNEVRKIVRRAVSEEISPQVAVSLKRGCSEYALAYPKYAEVKPAGLLMQYKKEWQAREEFFDKNSAYVPVVHDASMTTPFSNEIKGYTRMEIYSMQYWLCYAATIGDMSYFSISGRTMPNIPNLKRPPFHNTIPSKK
jgi:hypothetical protein